MKNITFEIFDENYSRMKYDFVSLLEEANFKHRQLLITIVSDIKIPNSEVLELFSLLNFYKAGRIKNILATQNDFDIIKRNLAPSEMLSIYKPSIILADIYQDNAVILESECIFLGTVSGTIFFKTPEAKMIASDVREAKIVHPKGIFYPFNRKDVDIQFRSEIV